MTAEQFDILLASLGFGLGSIFWLLFWWFIFGGGRK